MAKATAVAQPSMTTNATAPNICSDTNNATNKTSTRGGHPSKHTKKTPAKENSKTSETHHNVNETTGTSNQSHGRPLTEVQPDQQANNALLEELACLKGVFHVSNTRNQTLISNRY